PPDPPPVPDVYNNTETAMLFSALGFMNDLFDCRSVDMRSAIVREGQCLWVRPNGRKFKRDATSSQGGFEDTVRGISAGAQFAFAPNWFASVAGSYEAANLRTDNDSRSDSDRYHLGGALKYESGPWLFVAGIAGGIGAFDTSREVVALATGGTATSEHDIRYLSGQLRAGYQFDMQGWYARPLIDLNVTYLDRDGLTESGAGDANLRVDDGSETYFAVTPALEIGGDYPLVPGTVLKPFLIAGITVFADDEHNVKSAYATSPDLTFESVTASGDVFANIHAGATMIGDTSNFNLTFGYKGLYSDDVRQHGVYATGTWKF
ncbi:MAG: autotransporter outer membrane beta-barrel domain-containing protein, partial [Pseudomonadota bacterium]